MNAVAASLSALYTRVLDDRWNPILVKEVRQSLRGRFFRLAFFCTLVAVTMASIAMIMKMGGDLDAREGRDYFVGIYTCLAIAVMGLVPFQAFTAMGAEWEENTYDLLVISRMRPMQIVGGKFLTALVQVLLFFSTFTPFLVFSFLLQQVDLRAVGVLLGWALGSSLMLTMFALCLSTFSRMRFARVVLMAGLAGVLFAFVAPASGVAGQLLDTPSDLASPRFLAVATTIGVGGLVAIAYSFLTACNLLAHPEENRSTNVRLLTTAATLIAIGFCAWALDYQRRVGFSVDREQVSMMGVVLVILVSVPAIFFVTEPDALGRRTTLRVPRRLGLALFAVPFLPGGARGVLLWVLHVGLVTLFVLVAQAYYPYGGEGFLDDGIGAFLATLTYCAIYLLLPPGLFSPFMWNPQLRAAVRVLVPFLVVVFAFAPALLGFFLNDDLLMRGEHAGNPFHLLNELWSFGAAALWVRHVPLFAVLVGAGLALNLPRLSRGLGEVTRARRHRIDHEARRRARVGSPDAVART